MAYAVPASKASIRQNQFEFILPGSKKVHRITKTEYLPFGKMRELHSLATKLRAGGEDVDIEDVVAIFIAAGLPSDVVDAMDSEQMGFLLSAWGQASGITLGES